MALKVHKSTSPGRRDSVSTDFSDITKNKPEKSLLASFLRKDTTNSGVLNTDDSLIYSNE